MNPRCCDITVAAARAASLSFRDNARIFGLVLVSVSGRSDTTSVEKVSARPAGIAFGQEGHRAQVESDRE